MQAVLLVGAAAAFNRNWTSDLHALPTKDCRDFAETLCAEQARTVTPTIDPLCAVSHHSANTACCCGLSFRLYLAFQWVGCSRYCAAQNWQSHRH
jgi:hypothetical protein